MKLETADDQLMVSAAHRYCLGRRTYIIPVCTKWLRETWDQIDERTRYRIKHETLDAIERGEAGHDCDVYEWTELMEWIEEQNKEHVDHATTIGV